MFWRHFLSEKIDLKIKANLFTLKRLQCLVSNFGLCIWSEWIICLRLILGWKESNGGPFYILLDIVRPKFYAISFLSKNKKLSALCPFCGKFLNKMYEKKLKYMNNENNWHGSRNFYFLLHFWLASYLRFYIFWPMLPCADANMFPLITLKCLVCSVNTATFP